MSIDLDDAHMLKALDLARKGQGRVEPNPMVGALVVSAEGVVGEGYHEAFGGPHAEILALRQAGDKARGATLYVSLEPCSHHGKTPPCTDAIIQAGIKQVMAACTDPFPSVSGKGFEALRKAGIKVKIGCQQELAQQLNAPFFKLIQTGQPYVIAKWAMTADGKIATASGDSRWISSIKSRSKVHELRGRVDAVLVGIGTALADDPQLTPSMPGIPAMRRMATRIVLDSTLRLPLNSKLVSTAWQTPVLVVHSYRDEQRIKDLIDRKCECLYLEPGSRPELVKQLLFELGRRRMTNLLVEGGAQVLGSFFDAQAVDEVWSFIAPKCIGAAGAPSPVVGRGANTIDQAVRLYPCSIEQSDSDVLMVGKCNYPGP